jgi:hypothetical protein
MSRNIQNDHPWSADEIQYKLDRNLHKEVDENQKMFPPGSDLQDESPNNAPVLNLQKVCNKNFGQMGLSLMVMTLR